MIGDNRRAGLVEDQIHFVLSYLLHHHDDEDAWVLPPPHSRDLHSAPVFNVREEQHEVMRRLRSATGDPRRLDGPGHNAPDQSLNDEERYILAFVRRRLTTEE